MRKYLLPFILLLNLLAITAARAQDATTFVVGALKYTVISETGKEVSVEAADKDALTGNVDIPATVVNDNIEYTVTEVKSFGFSECSGLTDITLPATISEIGYYAFELSWSLENIEVDSDNNFFSSEDGVVFNKDKTTLVLCPAGKTGEYTVPATVKSIGEHSFSRSSLQRIILPDGILFIGGGAFSSSKLQNINLPAGLQSIGGYAFQNCEELQEIEIPASVISIGMVAFGGCTKLPSINVEEGNEKFISEDGVLYNKAKSELIQYPAGKIGKFSIPATVIEIGYQAFIWAKKLTEVVLPSNLSIIGGYAFCYCTGLDKIVDLRSKPQPITEYVFQLVPATAEVYVPKGTIDDYKNTEGWSQFSNYKELPGEGDSFVSGNLKYTFLSGFGLRVAVEAADKDALIGNVEIPASVVNDNIEYTVTEVVESGFSDCSGLTGIKLPATVVEIGDYAFDLSWLLENIEVDKENNVFSSEDGVVFNKDKTTLVLCPVGKTGEYTVPATVKSIGVDAFSRSSLQQIILPDGILFIGEGAFWLSKLQKINLPAGLQGIDDTAFNGSQELEKIDIPASVASIGTGAFGNCRKLTSINVEEGNEIFISEDGVLYNNAKSELIQYPAGKAGKFTVPETVTTIGIGAFRGSTGLTEVTLQTHLTTIGNNAFSQCTGLDKIVDLRSKPQPITEYVFEMVPTTAEVYVPKGSMEAYKSAEGWSRFSNYKELPGRGDRFVSGNLIYTILSDAGYDVSIAAIYKDALSGNVEIPASVVNDNIEYKVTAITAYGFSDCSGLTSIIMPTTVSEIGDYAFLYSEIEEVIFLETLTTIGYGSFLGSRLVEVNLPASLNYMDPIAFNECERLQNINVAEGNEIYSSVDGVLFNKEQTQLIQYPGGRKGEYTIPSTVTAIGADAFSHTGGLTAVTIPASVEKIDQYAFMNCKELIKFTDLSTQPQEISFNVFKDVPEDVVIRVLKGSKEFYEAADGWKDFSNIEELPGAGESFIEGDFKYTLTSDTSFEVSVEAADKESLEGDVVIPAVTAYDGMNYTVVAIGNEGFNGCTGVTSYSLPSTIRLIETGALAGCSNVETIDVDTENEFYSSTDGILYNKDNSELLQAPGVLKEIEIAESVEALGEFAFAGCKDLMKIVCFNAEPLIATQTTFEGVPADAVIYVPAGSGDAYRQAEGWKLFADIREIGDVKIKLNETTLIMVAEGKFQLTAEITNETLYEIVSEEWESSDPAIAIVDGTGVVTAGPTGTVGKAEISFTVTLSNGEKTTVSCNVTVESSSRADSIFGDIDFSAPYMVFDLKGIFVGKSTEDLPSGMYIIRQGKNVRKVRL